MSNKQKNKIPYFWNEEEMHNFFSGNSQTTEEYFHSIAADKEDRSFINVLDRPTWMKRLDKRLGITE
jgi:hypothetical protein